MSSQVSTIATQAAPSTTKAAITLRLCAVLLAVAGLIKVSQTGAIGFLLVLVLPWVLVAVRSRPGPRAALTAVILGTLEAALAGSRLAAGGSLDWFDRQLIIATIVLAPTAVVLGGHLLLRPREQ